MDCGLRGLMFSTKSSGISVLFKQKVSGNHISSVDLLSVASLFSVRSHSLLHKTCLSKGTKSSALSQIEFVLSHL